MSRDGTYSYKITSVGSLLTHGLPDVKMNGPVSCFPTVTEHANQAKETLYEINTDSYDG